MGGAEGGCLLADYLDHSGTVTVSNVSPRSGHYCYETFGDGAVNCAFINTYGAMGVRGITYFARAWFMYDVVPTIATKILAWSAGGAYQRAINLDTSGRVNGADGTLSDPLAPNTWHCIEESVFPDTGTHWTLQVRLNGVPLGGEGVSNPGITPDRLSFGQISGAANGTTLRFDDWAINDDIGSVQNSWCGTDGHVLVSVPTADHTIGDAWLLGNAHQPFGQAYDAVNNVPPVGVSNASGTATSQIADAAPASGSQAQADFTMQDYHAAGVPFTDCHITATWPVACISLAGGGTGRSVALSSLANPADSGEVNNTTGTAGASTFPTNWVYAAADAQSVWLTPDLVPRVRVAKRSPVSSVILVCFVGLNFEYTESDGGPVQSTPVGVLRPQAILRAVNW